MLNTADSLKTFQSKSDLSFEGFLSAEYFHKRILYEKKLTMRTNIESSLILLNLSFIESSINKLAQQETAMGIITDIIQATIREIDVRGWYDTDKIGILLPGTSYLGAIILCVKLINLMKKQLHQQLQYTGQLDNCFSVISYPDFFNDEDVYQKKSSKGCGKITDVSKKMLADFIRRYKINFHKSGNLLSPPFQKPIHSSPMPYRQKIIKRLFDIIFSLVGIIVSLPFFIVASIAIKLTSSGPVFFKQKRVGLHGKTFTCFKFRSMFNNCDQTIHREHIKKLSDGELTFFNTNQRNVLSYKLQNDTRITKVGRILRATSTDELPQLFNILKGDMSFVGPRPYTTYQVEHCHLWQHIRHIVKPGITGLAQLKARYNATFNDAYMMDLLYIKDSSLWLDLKIFMRTLPFIFSRRGAV